MTGLAEMFTLATAGWMINNRDPEPDLKNINNKAKKEPSNTQDIYNTNNSRKVRDDYEAKARSRFKQAQNVKKTKMVPKDYQEFEEYKERNKHRVAKIETFDSLDSDSVFSDGRSNDSFGGSIASDDGYRGFNPSEPLSVIEKMDNLNNNRIHENKIAKDKRTEKDTWIHQMDLQTFDNPDVPVSVNGTNRKTVGKHANMKRIELERDMELNGGYSAFQATDDGTYGVVDPNSKDFTHENMMPFVAKGPSQIQENARANYNQDRMELFTGSANNPDFRPKVERAPLFSPLVGAVNIYGDPVRTDEYKSRYFAGRNQNNYVPFQQVKVTPGLDIGYNTVGKQGYHDMYRPNYKTVDELRTVNNPKVSYGSYIGPAKMGEKGPVVGRVAQYKAPKFSERGTKDMVRGRSYITAPTIYGKYDPKNLATVNRGVTETVAMGPAKHDVDGITPDKARGNWRVSRKENYKNDHPRNLVMYESLKGNRNYNSFVPDGTQREMKSVKGHAYNGEENKSYVVNYEGFTPDVTMREIHSRYDRAGAGMGRSDTNKEVAINFNDTPDATLREVHNKYDRAGHLKGNKEQIQAIDYNDVPDATLREVHNKYDRAGHLKGNKEQIQAIDYNDVPDATMREVHNKYDRAGHLKGNKEQIQAINYNDTPDATMREVHNKYDRAGHLKGNREQIQAINYDDTPDATMREVHNKYDRAGHLKGNREQYTAIDYDDVPDATMRQVHNKYDRAGHLKGNKEQIQAINYDDVPDATLREVHNKYDRAGHLKGNREQYTAVNYDDVPDATLREVHNKYDRAGHLKGNREQYVAVDYDDVPDATMREVHNKYDRAGHVKGNREQYIAVDYDDVPDATLREIHNKYDRAGHVKGNREQYTAIDYDDVPDATLREVHNKYDRAGHVKGNREQYVAVDYDDVPDATMREVHNKYDRAGHIGANVGKQEYKAINWDDVPDATMRELHNKYDRAGHIGPNVSKQEYRAIDWDDVPDVTMREIHGENRDKGAGGLSGAKFVTQDRQGSRHKYMNMRTNAGKEALEDNRSPTKVGMNKGWTIDQTAFRFKCMPDSKWRPAVNTTIGYTNDKLASVNTKVPNKVVYNDRITAFTEECLEGNPLISNLIHKSVDYNNPPMKKQ